MNFTLTQNRQQILLDERGMLRLRENEDYLIELHDGVTSDCLDALHRTVYKPLRAGLGILNFGNFLGHTTIAGMRVLVQSRKLEGEGDPFGVMLADVSRIIAQLPFSFDTPTAIAFDDDPDGESSVLFHQWLVLREWLCTDVSGDPLVAELGKILHDPHRRLAREPYEASVAQISRIGHETIQGILTNPGACSPLPIDSALYQTGLARKLTDQLGRRLFPERVQSRRTIVQLDTPENRFVKYVLEFAANINRSFLTKVAQRPSCLNGELAIAAEQMMRELGELLAAPFFHDIGIMTYLPAQSMVLQRREGYRGFLSGYARLRASLQHPISPPHLKRILETKDVATLYEYWTYFQTAEVLKSLLGQPDSAYVIHQDDTSASLRRQTRLSWRKGATKVELAYNCSFRGKMSTESYSLPLRPDITLIMGPQIYVLDAKFKLKDILWTNEGPNLAQATFKPDDIYKMHTYREAIAGVVGAYVLYPGQPGQDRFFEKCPERRFEGVGAIALRPGEADGAQTLRDVLREIAKSAATLAATK
jgi:hypothetical protein